MKPKPRGQGKKSIQPIHMSNKAGQTSPEGEDCEITKLLRLGTKIGEGEQSTPAPNQPTPGSVQNLVPPGPTEPPDTRERVPPGPTVPPDTAERVPPGPTVPPDPTERVPPGPTVPPNLTDQVLPNPTVPPDPSDRAAARAGTSHDSRASQSPHRKLGTVPMPVTQISSKGRQAGPASRCTGSQGTVPMPATRVSSRGRFGVAEGGASELYHGDTV